MSGSSSLPQENCDLAVQLKVGPPSLASLPSVKIIFGNLEYLL
jgi:hypothetical protein